ncbi:Ig-like domain-containing protein [Flavobacterium johnsoniae]|uniref:Ig-like domain-containing protein n=1 Tax=Flavobacterium johnsoniae TaxID=986 RepID=UPI003D965760
MIKKYVISNIVLNLIKTLALLLIIFLDQTVYAQCANPVVGCSTTDLSNFGSDSNNNAATIEYDNFVSSYHATIVRTSEGTLQIWGEKIGSNGTSNVLSPITINTANFPALNSAVPLKAALGSSSGSVVQGIILATDGLYAWSTEGAVLDETITSSPAFEKITINGNTNGLPNGVSPGDVKMMFATYRTLVITTCTGEVWVISQTPEVRGNGGTGDSTTWYKVTTTEAGNPFLTDVVTCRGNYDGLMALKSDGTIFVWGSNVLLGDNSAVIPSQTRAVQMTTPAVTPKMIGSTGNNLLRSYYILATDGNLYSLGENASRQLGDWTSTARHSWVQPRYTAGGQVMNDIKWFSVQEHDATHGSVNVINANKNLYAFGQNSFNLLGTTGNSANPVMPTGLTTSDKILAVETGGHTSMIVKNCEGNFGYSGHRVRGSMGNGSDANATESQYTFATAPVQICGVESLPTINTTSIADGPNSKYCVGGPIRLNLSPSGGVLSILSGQGTVSGNTLTITAPGTVEVEYSISDACGGVPTLITQTFEGEVCNSDLQITKTVDNLNASVGTNSTFTITAANNGPYRATGVTVNDVLPAGYTFVSASPSIGTWTSPNWNIGNLANGASATLSIVALVNSSGPYANTAEITGNETDTDLLNNTATAVPVVNTNLSITKTINSSAVNVGDTVTFTITASNAGPSNATGITVNDILPAGYTFVSASTSGGVWSDPNWTISNLANGASETLTITAAVNASGSYTNTAAISGEQNDPVAGNNSASVTPAVNSVPVAYDDTNAVIPSPASATPINSLTASDTDGTITNYTIVTLPAHGALELNGIPVIIGQVLTPAEASNLTYDPDGTFTGNDTFTFTATDNSGALSSAATITIPVGNNPPTAHSANNTIGSSADSATAINPLTATDTDGTIADYTIVTLPAHGVLALNGTPVTIGQTLTPAEAANLTYDPDGTFTGNDSFNFSASDNLGASSSAATITISVGNNAPTAHSATNPVIPSPSDATPIIPLTASDTDGTITNYTIVTLPAHGILALNGIPVTIGQTLTPAEASNLTYDPDGTFTGNDTFTFTATDNSNAVSAAATITIPVGNNPPVAQDAVGAVIPSKASASPISALTATDTDGTIVSYTIVTLPAHGILALNGTAVTAGQILTPSEAADLTYDPSGSFTGNDTFTFTATDNNGAIDLTPAVITITVEKTNINAVTDENSIVSINQRATVLNVFDNDTLDNSPIIPSEVNLRVITADPKGFLTLNPNGTIELTPNTPAGNYTLTYEICERANPDNCSSASVIISVAAPVLTIAVQSYCSNNRPYVSYDVAATNFIPTESLTINWIDSSGNIVLTQNNMPLKGDILWPGTTVGNGIQQSDWPGWTLVNEQWIQTNDGYELTKPAVTMQFVLTTTQSVVVNYPAAVNGCNARPPFRIQAIDDNVVLADGINGDLEIINILDNDILNGVPVTALDVEIKGINFPSGITLNADGTIDIAPGTAGGNHTLTYEICEAADLSNCSTATVTVFVEVPAIAILKEVTFNDDNSNGFSDEGDRLTYNFSVINMGNTALQNVVVTDPLSGIILNGGPINLTVGETDNYSFTAVYTLSQFDLIAGEVSNQAIVTAVTSSGINISDKSDPKDINGDNPTILKLSDCIVEIFNAVSADGDEQNKRFYIKGIECYPDNSVQIFNRWGVLVFDREHYNNNDIVFKGISEGRVTIKDSNGLPEGTYYYILKYKNRQSQPYQKAGYLYLTK